MLKRILLAVGLLPLLWFLFWSSLAGMLAPQYNALSQHVSELTLAPGLPNTMVSITAIGTGALFIAFGIGLWIYSDRKFAWGAIAWILFGVAMSTNGIWPMGNPMHGLYSLGIINLVAPALTLIELPSLRNNGLAYGVTVFVSLAGIFYLWLNLTGNDPEHFRGLTQRLFSSINSLWPAVIAFLILRNEQATQNISA
jgi:Protein of unknown function (DUF998)